MPALILDTRTIAATIRDQLRGEADTFKQTNAITPSLIMLAVGDDNSIYDYMRVVSRQAQLVGIRALSHVLPADTTHEELASHIQELNQNPKVHAISLQSPLPPHLSMSKVALLIDPAKDVEGLHPYNTGQITLSGPALVAPPALGAMKLLALYSINPANRFAVVIGRNPIIGKPLAALLTEANATVTICHRQTPHLQAFTRMADLVVAAAQTPGLITGEMLKPGAVVLDFGINYPRTKNRQASQIIGDVAFESARQVAGAITPMPGGTGPMTVIALLQNVLKATKQQIEV